MKSTTLGSTLLLAIVLVTKPEANAEEDPWNIVTLAGDTMLACTFDTLSGTLLALHCAETDLLIPVDSINSLFREGESGIARGATIGAIVGAIGGAAYGLARVYDKVDSPGIVGGMEVGIGALIVLGGAIGGGLAGAIVGGLAGYGISPPNSYELAERTLEEKLQIVRSLTVSRTVPTVATDTSSDESGQ